MTAKELNTMVNAMRTNYNKLDTRFDVTHAIYCLYKGCSAIGKYDMADKLVELYREVDGVDTNELVKLGTFR